jgi:hypothetical protein
MSGFAAAMVFDGRGVFFLNRRLKVPHDAVSLQMDRIIGRRLGRCGQPVDFSGNDGACP